MTQNRLQGRRICGWLVGTSFKIFAKNYDFCIEFGRYQNLTIRERQLTFYYAYVSLWSGRDLPFVLLCFIILVVQW